MCCPETDRYSQRIGKLSAPELIRVGRLPPSNIEGVTLEPAFVFEDCNAVFMRKDTMKGCRSSSGSPAWRRELPGRRLRGTNQLPLPCPASRDTGRACPCPACTAIP